MVIFLTNITTFASNRILDNLLGREPLIVPAIWFLELSTTPLGNDGINATPPTDPAYQRFAIPNDRINFSEGLNKVVSFIREQILPPSSVAWPRVEHFLIYDNGTGGNVWFYGELQNSIDVEVDTSPFLEANINNVSLDICGGSTTDMAMSTFAANSVLNNLFGRSPTLVSPPNFFLGVSSTPINIEGIGFTEPSGGGYQRLQLPNDKNTFTFAVNKLVTFANTMKFPASTVSWGTMTHFFITDTPTGQGNVWWNGKLLHDRNVEIATTLAVIPEGFNWVLDACTPTVVPSP
jgi:hypothetical protein